MYESKSYWDKEKKQPRAKRTLVGRLNPETGEILPTDGRGRRRGQGGSGTKQEKSTLNFQKTERLFFGATYLFDQIGLKTGVAEDLKACFPETYRQMLSIVYYLILEDSNPLCRFGKWRRLHRHPAGEDIPSQRSTEIFQSVTEEAKMKFFRLQGRRKADNEYWAYDTTSISSYSELLRQVKYGKNKDNDRLAQINLALVFGEDSGLPFYYRKLAGNITDVKTVSGLIKEFDALGFKKVKLAMDRGFCSADNINALYKNHYKFLISASTVLSYAKDFIRETGTKKENYEHYSSEYQLYCFSKTVAWDYKERRPYKKDTLSGERRMYLHLYFNPEKQLNDSLAFNRKMDALKREILTGKHVAAHEKDYLKYFETKETPGKGIVVTPKQDAMNAARERFGFFVLISNEIKDPLDALRLYRTRDVVEKAFGNLKERLNFRRTSVSSETSLEGKLFVEFVALIYISFIKKRMEEKKLFEKYTMRELLDELDVIECFLTPGKKPLQGEVTKKQEQIYMDLGVKPLLANTSDNS